MRLVTCKCLRHVRCCAGLCVLCRACPGCAGRGPRRAAMAMPLRSARRAGIILQSTCHTKRVAGFVSSVFRFSTCFVVENFPSRPHGPTSEAGDPSPGRRTSALFRPAGPAAESHHHGARPRAQCGHGLCAFIRVPRQSLRRMFRAPSRMPSPTSVHTRGSPRCGHRASAWHDAA
jgi:hypothetical protein